MPYLLEKCRDIFGERGILVMVCFGSGAKSLFLHVIALIGSVLEENR